MIMESKRKNPSVVIIGAGQTGMGLVIKLREAGIHDVTLLEKADNIGGTWRENRYPGVACDVPSHAYTYSFEPNLEWSKMFAGGNEIQKYFERVYYKYGVNYSTRLGEAVTSCVYDDNTEKWTVKTSKGNTYIADILFSAQGILHQPVLPDIVGRDSFKGEAMHSAQWKDNIDFSGKRIGVIGTGSTAAQIIPELINMKDTKVTVFQRTPQWIVHADNKEYTPEDIQKFRDKPSRSTRVRNFALGIFAYGTSALVNDSLGARITHRLMAWNAARNLKAKIKDLVLREKLTPKYKFGCKRVVMNGTFYDAIQKPNAYLETNGIECIQENGIKTKDGKLHELDIIVYATGFDPAAYMRPMEFVGRNGLTIDKAWEKKIQAYRSLCIPGFPNFFLMLGPNSPIGNYSVIFMSEVQSDYAIKLVKEWQAGNMDIIEAKQSAVDSWRAMLKARMGHTVWTSGCNSWYLDADGDPLTWPDTWTNWMKLMANVDLTAFYRKGEKIDTKVMADKAA
jgi:cation diffusion facilitator CzcD-associated flavoprotein CzcO